jgi:hypothetical protein
VSHIARISIVFVALAAATCGFLSFAAVGHRFGSASWWIFYVGVGVLPFAAFHIASIQATGRRARRQLVYGALLVTALVVGPYLWWYIYDPAGGVNFTLGFLLMTMPLYVLVATVVTIRRALDARA